LNLLSDLEGLNSREMIWPLEHQVDEVGGYDATDRCEESDLPHCPLQKCLRHHPAPRRAECGLSSVFSPLQAYCLMTIQPDASRKLFISHGCPELHCMSIVRCSGRQYLHAVGSGQHVMCASIWNVQCSTYVQCQTIKQVSPLLPSGKTFGAK
jgi:hypothetical protein